MVFLNFSVSEINETGVDNSYSGAYFELGSKKKGSYFESCGCSCM